MRLSQIALALTNNGGGGLFPGSSLSLDLINGNNTLDPRITFVRTSNAMRFNSAGVLEYAPHNLLLASEQFDASNWFKTNVTITANAVVAPDGTTTADTLAATGADSLCYQNVVVVNATSYTYSVYLRADAPTTLTIYLFDNAFGTLGSTVANVTTTWQRFSVSGVSNSTGAKVSIGGGSTFTTGETVYVWGAQLNVGALQPYYPSTPKNLLGFTQEFDNAAWTKSNSFVQTNQIRNNTMQGAVAGSPGTLPTNWTLTATGLTQEIVGVGTESGISYIDIKLSGTTGSTRALIRPEPTTQIAASNGQTWTGSSYVRLVAGSLTNVTSVQLVVRENDSGGAELAASTTDIVPTSASLASQRGTVTRTLSNATAAFVMPIIYLNYASGATVNITLRIGMPQLVQGASAGDVVATYGTAKAVMYTAPDGTLAADKLVEDTATSEHRIGSTSITWAGGGVYTTSFYAKAAERFRFDVLFGTAGNWVSGDPARVASFNLQSGTVSTPSSPGTASITSVGGGWYRCRVTASAVAAPAASGVFFRLADSSGSTTYTGDGTSGIYIWGAQLSDSASLDPYVYNPAAAPSASAYYGPRFDYDPSTLAPRGLLIEEQRVNSIRNNTMVGAVAGIVGSGGAFPTNWSSSLAVDGLTLTIGTPSTESGISYVDVRVSGTASTARTNISAVAFEVSNNIAAVSGQTWTGSSYVKQQSGSTSNITNIGIQLSERDAAGNYLVDTTNIITPTVSALSGQRNPVSRTLNNASTAYVRLGVTMSYSAGAAIDITLRIGLPQLEQGAFATSPILTSGAAATRAADVAVMTGTNFSSWYNQNAGTFFVQGQKIASGTTGFPRLVQASDATNNNSITVLWAESLNRLYGAVNTSGVTQADIGNNGTTQTASHKTALAYEANNFALSNDGLTAVTDTSGTVPAVDRMFIGKDSGSSYFNGWLSRTAYYPRRLSNTELQAITS